MSVKRGLNAMASKWYIFLAWAVLMVIFWSWLGYMLTRPSEEQTLGVFVCSESCDQQSLLGSLQEVRPEYIEQFDFKCVSPDDDLYSVYYDAFAVDDSDLIIMPESKLSEYSYVDFFALDTSLVERTFGRSDLEYYYNGDAQAYGIKIDAVNKYDIQPADGETENYYLFFNKNSLHLGEWNNTSLDGALVMARVFL